MSPPPTLSLPMERKESDGKNVLLKYSLLGVTVFLGLFVAFVFAELMLRAFASDWLVQRMKFLGVSQNSSNFGTDLDWPIDWEQGKFVRFHPNSQFDVAHYEYHHKVNIDELGGRVSATVLDKKDQEIIPFLGDSICFGLGVEDEQTYVSLLNQKSKHRLTNLAVPGSSLPVYLNIIERRHQKLGAPHLYVFNFFIGNDLSDIVTDYKKKSEPDLMEQWLRTINRAVFHNHVLNQLYVTQFIRAKLLLIYNSYQRDSGKQELMDPLFFVIQKNKKEYLNQAEKYLDMELKRLDHLSKTLGFSAFFILLPHRDQVSDELLKLNAQHYGINPNDLDVTLPNEMVKKKLVSYGIPCVDVLECLRKKHQSLYYVQDGHFLPVGHEAVRDCIFPAFEDMEMRN